MTWRVRVCWWHRHQIQQLRIQAEEIKKLKAKQDTEERNEKQKILVVNGLEKENPTDHFIKIVKENLDIELKNTEFSLATKEFRKRTKKNEADRRNKSTSGNMSETPVDTKTVVTVNFASIWKKREVYSGRAGLRGTNIFLSEDLGASQRSLFFKCRELRRSKKIQSTWTQDLKIFVRDNNDQKIEINTEADLMMFTQPPPQSPLPLPLDQQPSSPLDTPIPRPSLTQSMWSNDSNSFHGFSREDLLGYHTNSPGNWQGLYFILSILTFHDCVFHVIALISLSITHVFTTRIMSAIICLCILPVCTGLGHLRPSTVRNGSPYQKTHHG